ncbi:Inositol 2-dehydrogenase/D-chiro-inositol 3-dehydrogenase [Dyadobacter sp. CECT 9623]|uniref:Inositol 2-dehydrogenase/D-chiro-inositol 3-dehydrogenase n=1 Tax=Dyadobacter linearis TaxID=2823330 RepID=A0ABN7RCF9_9BACT|nr:Gfo/Idh/MocA family oxidoreductase [Dyadobacter sp. CECT 9623]CAG5069776.1 Inositol 2-dehydrogenase/D-chiro-inositol 3-dehydrogenase [Dyadobacter sp. CECT 9623]
MENQQAESVQEINRRKFVKAGAIAAASFMIVPRHVLGKGFIPPSDKLNIAAVGCGGKADVNIRLAYNNGADNMVALCDVDDRQSEKYRKQFPKAPYYRDYRKMLEKEAKNIDAVLITTPDHMHFPIAMSCIELGKHVYVEKPLTKDIWEARNLTQAAKKYKVVTQMGNQGSSSDGTRQTEAIVQSGVIGDVYKIEVWTDRPVWPQGVKSPKDKNESQPIPKEVDWDLWLGNAPKRPYHEAYMPFRWRGYWDFGTGALGDMGCHFIDVPFRAMKLGYPTSVECSVGSVYSDFFSQAFFDDVCPPSSSIHLKFASKTPGKEISFSWYDGGIRPQLPDGCDYKTVFGSVDGGMLFIGTKGILSAEMFGENPRLWPEKQFENVRLNINPRELVPGGPAGHQQQFVQACKKGFGAYTSSSFDQSGPLTEIVLMGNLAVRSYLHREAKADGKGFTFPGRQKLIWDGDNMKITNFDIANQFVKREYRKGW